MNSKYLDHLYQEDIYHIKSPVLVIIPTPWHKILETDKALLTKILWSVRINLESVVVQTCTNFSLETLSLFNPGKVLVFGSTIEGESRCYETVVHNEHQVLLADDLSKLDDSKKKILWVALKQMFGV